MSPPNATTPACSLNRNSTTAMAERDSPRPHPRRRLPAPPALSRHRHPARQSPRLARSPAACREPPRVVECSQACHRSRYSVRRSRIRSRTAGLGMDRSDLATCAATWKFRRSPVLSSPSAASPVLVSSLRASKLQASLSLPKSPSPITIVTPRPTSSVLTSAAQQAGAAALITTEKDRIRLEKLISAMPVSVPLETVRLTVSIENESHVCNWLSERLTPHPASLPL